MKTIKFKEGATFSEGVGDCTKITVDPQRLFVEILEEKMSEDGQKTIKTRRTIVGEPYEFVNTFEVDGFDKDARRKLKEEINTEIEK